jgi:transcriptional regulator of acetoin/glycerol metabolism
MGVFADKIKCDFFLRAIGVSSEEMDRFEQKSIHNGVQKDTMRIRFRLSGKMLERLLMKCQTLMDIIRKEELLGAHAFYFPYLLMVTDANGVIIYITGDDVSVSNAERMNNIGVGSSMSFSSAGTNAISAAIELQRAVVICGEQHFLETMRDWITLCIPVRNSENHIAAYLTFSSFHNIPGPIIYPCLESISARLEYQLKKAETQGKAWFVEEILEERLKNLPLTPREKEVAMYWLLDYDYKQISKVVGISENTVRVYVTRINNKLRVNSKASLILRVLGAI